MNELVSILIAAATIGAVTLVLILGSKGSAPTGGFDPEMWQQEQEWNKRLKELKNWK